MSAGADPIAVLPVAIGAPGAPELLILLVVVVLVLGPKRLTGLGKSLGSNAREFRDAVGGPDGDDAGPAVADARVVEDAGAGRG